MYTKQNILFVTKLITIFFTLVLTLQTDDNLEKKDDGIELSANSYRAFIKMFVQCYETGIPNQQFSIDNVKSYINYPSKTTVGFAPKFTRNRKFFANLVATKTFKEALNKDADELWKTLIKKIKYCDEMVMDQSILKYFYDRELDQSRV